MMNLDFGILWIEDFFSPEEEENLKRRVLDTGFIPRIKVIENSIGIDELARLHTLYHCYDIILLDYRLKNENGDDLAPRVRRLFPSTAILFYSGTVQETDLRRMIAEKQVEGVYCSARERFIDRTGALIDQTAQALNRLSGMRGLSMKVVAECDEIMREAILSMCDCDTDCAKKISDLDDDVLSFLDTIKEKYKSSMDGDISSRLDTHVVDSIKLFKHFRRLTQIVTRKPYSFNLDEASVERLRELRNLSAEYDNNVIKKRNILGHVVEIYSDNGWILQGSDEIRVEDFPDIRRSFATYIEAFREMRKLVVSLDE